MKFDIKNLCIWKEDSVSCKHMTGNSVREIRDLNVIYPFYMASQFLDTDVIDLNLSVRSYHCLKRMGWDTVGDIIRNIESKQDLLRVRNLGKTSAEEIFINLLSYHQDLLANSEKQIYRKKFNALNGLVTEQNVVKTTETCNLVGGAEKQLEIVLDDSHNLMGMIKDYKISGCTA